MIGSLGGTLDPRLVISCLQTEWNRRQGNSTTKKDTNVVFQTGARTAVKCENCGKTGHMKAKCWGKGGGQEGQYPEWFKGKKDPHTSNVVKMVSDTHIVWAYGHEGNPNMWFADSAATIHVTHDRNDFTSYHKYESNRIIKVFGKNEVQGIGEGDVLVETKYQGRVTRIQLTKVMHVPGAEGKILSLKVLDQKGYESRIVNGHIYIMKGAHTYAQATLGGELYEIDLRAIPSQESILAAVKRDPSATDLPTWHRRLGHLGDTIVKKLNTSGVVKGMVVTNLELKGFCEDCVVGKMDEKPFVAREDRDTRLFRTLHTDLIGSMNPEARWSHAKYCLVVNDDCSGFGFTFNLRQKSDTIKSIIELDKSIETKFQKRVHTLRADNRGEFLNDNLLEYCRDRGISIVTSIAHTPAMNGRAERRNRILTEGARTMLKDSDLGKDLWGEAIATHMYLRNRCPSSVLPNGVTPYEMVYGECPSIGHLRVFGAKCFIKIPDETCTKLDDKGTLYLLKDPDTGA